MQLSGLKDRRLSVAPMMDWTDRHCRFFHRLLAPSTLLYTEMITTGALLHGDLDHLLGYSEEEHPLALQLGGSDPCELARSARIAAARGFDEVNLNVGCPSDRVQHGRFGACLMLEPELVRDCARAMIDAVDIPVTVKCRLGVDDCDSYDYFSDFVHRVAESGCRVFVVHARKALLKGLSPKDNREIPELRYRWVYRLKRENQELEVIVNGGLESVAECRLHLQHADGVMLGRVAYQDPWVLQRANHEVYSAPGVQCRESAVHLMAEYAARKGREGVLVRHITRHMLGLFHGQPGARQWRRAMAEGACRDGADAQVLLRALESLRRVENCARDAA